MIWTTGFLPGKVHGAASSQETGSEGLSHSSRDGVRIRASGSLGISMAQTHATAGPVLALHIVTLDGFFVFI